MLLPCMQIKYMPHLKRYGRSFRYDKSVSFISDMGSVWRYLFVHVNKVLFYATNIDIFNDNTVYCSENEMFCTR